MSTSYVIWNNKGGVGKSTITFNLASRYAELNPEKKILVIDMCPQANASMMLLGGGLKGEAAVHALCTSPDSPTIVGYLTKALGGGPLAPSPNPLDYVSKVKNTNSSLPENLFLVCGDPNLELIAAWISNLASSQQVLPNVRPWVWVHEVMRRFIDLLKTEMTGDWVVFIDTNPSFSSYTELAICAVERLLLPVNADDSSRTAIGAMHSLLYGQNPPHPIYGAWTFAHNASVFKVKVPKIHLVIGNRLTQNLGAAAAFAALSQASVESLYGLFLVNSSRFTARVTVPVSDVDFVGKYSVLLRDFNTAGVVAAHEGVPVSSLQSGSHILHGRTVRVDNDRITDCRIALDNLVRLI
ncbi:ParA family protein [Xanthomonas campestris]|uniref:ParA family protein n=1 Tax=Xanthomonas campestris TaxID=339 RepID=UPI0023654AB0|nr:ParA family protein [Xanthomonas campestris]MEA9728352.1 ParA family protein [Xanthomonas campestris pv. raphani]WDJ06319.1 AAA family ATPase [Xanthomonas campestris pv. incanae]